MFYGLVDGPPACDVREVPEFADSITLEGSPTPGDFCPPFVVAL